MSFDNKHLRCRNCVFWWPTSDSGHEADRQHSIFGQCRCNAPEALVTDLPDHKVRYPSWASTKGDDWCGKHVHITN